MASIFYKKGPAYLGEILKGLETWMDKKGYESIGDFKGRLSLTKAANPALYEKDPIKATRLAKERSELAATIARQEEIWLELSAEYEEGMAE